MEQLNKKKYPWLSQTNNGCTLGGVTHSFCGLRLNRKSGSGWSQWKELTAKKNSIIHPQTTTARMMHQVWSLAPLFVIWSEAVKRRLFVTSFRLTWKPIAILREYVRQSDHIWWYKVDGRKEEGLSGGPASKDMLHLVPSLLDMSVIEGSIEAIACGNQHTVILTSMGTVYTFGRNVDGQLGMPIFILKPTANSYTIKQCVYKGFFSASFRVFLP